VAVESTWVHGQPVQLASKLASGGVVGSAGPGRPSAGKAGALPTHPGAMSVQDEKLFQPVDGFGVMLTTTAPL